MNSSTETAHTAEVVVAGHICLDIIPHLPEPGTRFLPGHLVLAGAATLSTGGAVANVGLALHRLGASVRLIGRIGDDLFGAALRGVLTNQGANLAATLITAPGEPTSYSLVLSPPVTDRTFIHCPGCNDTFGVADLDPALLHDARVLHVGYPPVMARLVADNGRELVELLQMAKAAGVTTSVDLAMLDPDSAAARADWPQIFAAALPSTDFFLPSIEELLLLLHRPWYDALIARGPILEQVTPALLQELANEALALGARVVAIKLGERGTYLRTSTDLTDMGRGAPADLAAWANAEVLMPCFAVEPVGTTGAGDATIAGLLLGVLRGLGPEAALRMGCAVGAYSVEAADAVSGIRPWEETAARVAAGWVVRTGVG